METLRQIDQENVDRQVQPNFVMIIIKMLMMVPQPGLVHPGGSHDHHDGSQDDQDYGSQDDHDQDADDGAPGGSHFTRLLLPGTEGSRQVSIHSSDRR